MSSLEDEIRLTCRFVLTTPHKPQKTHSCTLLDISNPYGVIDIALRIALSRLYFHLSFAVPLLLLPRTSVLVRVEACNPVLKVSNPTIT